ncbi:transport inhibitor response 1-like protein [Impatiens glandulifera]|uniref:transport inhibitor response 1-like protein n=1 Tax=Impatiens glandulifera TaxID=253017 RepID=UPI001FB0C127|nr:transport inhibitor response 1-like protein [Impatiens glandulifera]
MKPVQDRREIDPLPEVSTSNESPSQSDPVPAAINNNSNKFRDYPVDGCGGVGPNPDQVLENVLEHVLFFLTSRRDRNSASQVCKSWYKAEALTRSELFIGNCYSISPCRVTDRFRRVRTVTLKGKPRFADFNLMPRDWGAYFSPWVATMGSSYRALEKLSLKRMFVMDKDLEILASSFPCFKELVLISCEGFGTNGLAVIAGNCRQLRVLDLIEDEVADNEVDWISHFPDGETYLESLTFDCLEFPINFEALERLVARSPNLTKLRMNRYVSIGQLQSIISQAPQLTHLGTGSFSPSEIVAHMDNEPDYLSALSSCKSLVCLSGFREVVPEYLPAIYPVCTNLTSLNLSFANVTAEQLKPVIRHCHCLQTFWVLDSVCDEGLQAVAATCKELRELRVFPFDANEDGEGPVSDLGLHAISEGCRKLESILYFCQRMTNAAVIAMSKNCPNLLVFRLCIMGRHRPDHITGLPMDEGFGAIVKNCNKLTRLATSGLLTDNAFKYIGEYGKLVRTLSVAFAGDSDMGLKYLMEGCPRLEKLEIRDSPFGDSGLLAGLNRYYKMRFLWMSSCRLTLQGCQAVASRLPNLVVEIMNDNRTGEPQGEEDNVEILYMYRSLGKARSDVPRFVKIL